MTPRIQMFRLALTAVVILAIAVHQCGAGCEPKKLTEVKYSLRQPLHANASAKEFRVKIVYSERFQRLPNYASIGKEYVEPGIKFWMKVLKPKKATVGPLKLQRSCITNLFYWVKENGVDQKYCKDECLNQAKCLDYNVPREYWSECRKKTGRKESITPGGTGAPNTDFLVFVDFTNEGCGTTTIAFAGSCQQNAETDRPEIAYVNYCTKKVEFKPEKKESIYMVTIHELGHALGFIASSYAFMRYEDGRPRTARSGTGNTPSLGFLDEIYLPDKNTVEEITKPWLTATGMTKKTTYILKTENVLKVAREHFNCKKLRGVELENNEGNSLIGSHFEKSLYMGEVMMPTEGGIVTDFTLAFMKDTGWYEVDTSVAKKLTYGKNKGCTFATLNCLDYMRRRLKKNLSTEPWCGEVQLYCQSNGTYCNLRKMTRVVDRDINYFKTIPNIPKNEVNMYAGEDKYTDYCPYYRSCG